MQSLETKSSRPRPTSFVTETRPRRDLRPSRPRLEKMGLETRLETETKSRDSITGRHYCSVTCSNHESRKGTWSMKTTQNREVWWHDTSELVLPLCCYGKALDFMMKNIDSQKKKTLDHMYVTDLSDYNNIDVAPRTRREFRTLYIY